MYHTRTHIRFFPLSGTYTLGGNYAKYTDQSIANDGHNIDLSLCNGFDSIGDERGQPGVMVDNLDYGEFHVKSKSYLSVISIVNNL